MGQVAMYRATLFFYLEIYATISSSIDSLITPTKGGYYHVPSYLCRGILTNICLATIW